MAGGSRLRSPASAHTSVIVQNGEYTTPSATHDISRVSFHVKHIDTFAKSLEDVRSLSLSRSLAQMRSMLAAADGVCAAAVGDARIPQPRAIATALQEGPSPAAALEVGRPFVLPELEDLERTLREDYTFETDVFPIPSENGPPRADVEDPAP